MEPPERRIGLILRVLAREYAAECALRHTSAWELLVATILSAQCTDVRVNQVTETLFPRYPGPQAFARADLEELQQAVRPTGFFRNKAKALQGAARLLLAEFGGEVPSTMEELLRLSGVARKTANVILGTWFRKNEGIVVDTHVGRVARRLKLTRHEDPSKVEKDLQRLVPRKQWTDFGHRVIWHGRKICTARSPKCPQCPIGDWCPSKGRV